MKYKLLIVLFALTFMVGLVSAELIFEQNKNINLRLPCSYNGTFCNESAVCNITITYPNESLLLDNHLMTNNGNGKPNVSISGLNVIGTYQGYYHCCQGGYCDSDDFEFNVTPTGFAGTLGFYFLIFGISAAIMTLGFWIRDAWIVILGTFGLYFIGIYVLFYGIDGMKDVVLTQGLAVILLGVAGYISIKSGIETLG